MKTKRTTYLTYMLVCMVVTNASVQADNHLRPNIIFILADDVGAESMTPYGGSSWSTPRIDSIATQGMRFANAYANPSCAPSRAEFLTGRYPFRTGVTFPTLPNGPLGTEETTLAEVLKNAGYATGLAGKWNLRYGSRNSASETEQEEHIEAHGFDEHRTFIGHTIVYGDPSVETNFVPYQINQWACHYISRMATNDSPFYLQYSMGLVHWPLTATPLNPSATQENSTDAELYGNMMTYMDHMVGNMLDTLDSTGISSNTVVIFAGDNGTWARISSTFNGEQVQGGKLTSRDTGSWVPFYVRWPGVVAPGSLYDGLTDFSDIFPTLIEIGQGVVPNYNVIDGISFLPQLQGASTEHRNYVYCSDIESRTFVRDKEWKLISTTNLYDISNSPFEERLVDEASQTPEEMATRVTLLGYLDDIHSRETIETGADSDADGSSDYEEIIAGTNPTNSASFFGIESVGIDNGFQLNWQSVSGRAYNVYWSTNLLENFQILETNIPWTASSFTNSTDSQNAYYKIKVRLEE